MIFTVFCVIVITEKGVPMTTPYMFTLSSLESFCRERLPPAHQEESLARAREKAVGDEEKQVSEKDLLYILDDPKPVDCFANDFLMLLG